jgi:hypothetical protein
MPCFVPAAAEGVEHRRPQRGCNEGLGALPRSVRALACVGVPAHRCKTTTNSPLASGLSAIDTSVGRERNGEQN